jgi:hypothetical protein
MKMLSHIEKRAAAYGCGEEFDIYPMTVKACTPGWEISVIDRMPQELIITKMKAGVILGQQLAIQADRFLETIDESYYPLTGS